MAPNFQSSFIPKEPVTEEVFKRKKTGIAGVLAVSLLIASIIISIGLYVYKGMVKNEIQNLESELSTAEQNIDKKTIAEMSQFSKKLSLTKSVVLKHQVLSKFLEALASSTVSSVQFTSFDYGNMEQGKLNVSLKGKATGYASVALQEQIFSQNKYFKSLSFSNLNLTDKGLVSFDLAISVDPQISTYSP
ncbi:MAG: hypothetical protein WC657_01125 [Candidatus Paceibacterota bacterium]|jgi:hypothetical protein